MGGEKRLTSRVLSTLAALLEQEVTVLAGGSNGSDLVVSGAGHTFVVEAIGEASAGRVASHAERATEATKRLRRRAIPLVAVPFMGEAGRQACERAGVAWFDFSGNARIIAPGLRIIIDGCPNRFRRRGRPASVFAPKSSRVARWLLMHPDEALTQREIAVATGVSEGFVSRIVARLQDDRYVVREDSGGLRVKDPHLLLDAWREQYSFSKHTLIQGHVAARSGDSLAASVSEMLEAEGVEHAATGLAAAWQFTRFAAFRIATFFVEHEPPGALKAKLGFRDDPRGANLWLAVPNDLGVFHGVEDRGGIRCVHPVQAYLDLQGHPERSSEAAERLRAQFLSW